MGSKPSKAERPAPANAKTVVVPRIPQDVIDEILDQLATYSDLESLRACSLVSKSWVSSCRPHLFHTAFFNSESVPGWLKTFPSPEESPARHVRHLRIQIGGLRFVPKTFFGCIPWFTNAEKIFLLGPEPGDMPQVQIPSPWSPSQSVTSLTIETDMFTLKEIRDFMAALPNLDDLSLSGYLGMDEIGTSLAGGTGLGGKLVLRNVRHATMSVMGMLLEAPTGLRFTEVEIHSTRGCLLSVIRLVEACCKTLVKLSYTVSFPDGYEACEQSFDFSKFPNLREVGFGVGWIEGGPYWIPMALSTLRPATSPRLSAIQLDFTRAPNRHTGATIKVMGNDLRRAADEVTRIKREFEEVVDFTVLRGDWMGVVFDTLNIFQGH